jgi:hypothetical protein
MVSAGGLRTSNEKRHAVKDCVGHTCRPVIVKEREFVVNISFECVCIGLA